ncbi:phosphoribosylglycinamide formyltransferase [Psychromonas sp. CD1]|uniref:phosphoribosylglycinamide formyltransferase n=1 Tax=Psychromonas sp. CD1 TaxID=1979839 RepID=UPI000B9AFCFA|nr:phosphoribosylglycinamide formyltransferase [Psychromonas sp. CD1]
MQTKKIIVLISGDGSNLQALIEKLHLPKENIGASEIVLVISNNADAYGLTRAKDAQIKHLVISSDTDISPLEYDALLTVQIEKLQPDLILLAGFMRILGKPFVRQYGHKMLNIHPSLLPKYQGINTHQRAIDNAEKEHGASVHFVTPEIDNGPVVLQAKVPIFDDDNVAELSARVHTQEHLIYPLSAQWFLSGRLKLNAGNAELDGKCLAKDGYAPD